MRPLGLLVALVLLAAACGGSSEPETQAETQTTTARATTAAPQTGPGSEITGESLDGGQLSLADFRGKRVLVNVWSSW
jgi:hypothetical protein